MFSLLTSTTLWLKFKYKISSSYTTGISTHCTTFKKSTILFLKEIKTKKKSGHHKTPYSFETKQIARVLKFRRPSDIHLTRFNPSGYDSRGICTEPKKESKL